MSNQADLQQVKNRMERLRKEGTPVRVSVMGLRCKPEIKEEPAVVTGLFPRVFTVEMAGDFLPKTHSLQYIDVLTGQVVIEE